MDVFKKKAPAPAPAKEESADDHRARTGKCPKGYHFNSESGACEPYTSEMEAEDAAAIAEADKVMEPMEEEASKAGLKPGDKRDLHLAHGPEKMREYDKAEEKRTKALKRQSGA